MTNTHNINKDLWSTLSDEEKKLVNRYCGIVLDRKVMLRYTNGARKFFKDFVALCKGDNVLKAKAVISDLLKV